MGYVEVVELYHNSGLVGIKLCSSDIEVNDVLLIALYRLDPAIIPLLVIKPHVWMEILLVEPGMISLCSIDRLPDWIIFHVLSEKGELLSWFDYRLAALSTRYWPGMLEIFPHLVDDPRVPYDTLEVSGWRRLVCSDIIFHSRCDWHIFAADDWLWLFRSRYASECKARWMTLPGDLRKYLIDQNPILTKYLT